MAWLFGSYDAQFEQIMTQLAVLQQTVNRNHSEVIEWLYDTRQPVYIPQPQAVTPPITKEHMAQKAYMNELNAEIERRRQHMGDSHGF